MFGYFTFSFFDKNANNTLCIYKSSSSYDSLNLKNIIELSFKKYAGIDNVILIVNKKDFKKIKNDADSEIFERDKKISNISCVSFSENGTFNKIKEIKGNLNITYINEIRNELIKEGILTICKENSIINIAPPGTQFMKLTGKKSNEFIRASDMLSNDAIICFIAYSLLEYWNDLKVDYIYIDTMSISSIIYKLIYLKKSINKKIKIPNIISFSSYTGIHKINFINKERTLVIISASSSGSMSEEISLIYNLDSQRIITLLSYINNETKLLCNIIELSNKKSNNFPGLTNIKIVGEYFSTQVSEPREVIIKYKHAPEHLKSNMNKYLNDELFNIQKSFAGSTKEIFVDAEKFILSEYFNNWYEENLKFHVPLYISYIVYTNDNASHSLAEKALEFYKRYIKDEELPILLSSEELGNKAEVDGNAKGILILSAVVSKGNELLSIGRDLRNFAKDTSRTFIVGMALPTTNSDFDIFKLSLTYSPNRENYNFYTYWTIPIGKRKGLDNNENSWDLERQLLSKNDFEDISYARERLEILNMKSIGLNENIFNVSIDNQSLKIRDDFVFWIPGYDKSKKLSSAVYLTVSAAIQNSRENEKLLIFDKLISDDYQRALLSPDCFSRFNDGIIQSSLIRTCNPKELDYSISKQVSKKMKDILLGIIRNVTNKRGEAIIEFLVALATKRMNLTIEDLKEINEYINKDEIRDKLGDKEEFCLKLMKLVID